ncbi:MAG: KOW domain-containing RNA-binding protein [Clostridiales bacterium]|nr:KOW domain-containing RNA-binding protein [Eubacteriales bacterium]MDH7566936.1 KOW domain-containing RNA-binding protein [Clostridiales bacterium]
MEVTLGQVVYSKAGRDAGRKFVVIEIVDAFYVLLSDGDLRRIEKPKKKKIKHLKLTGEINEYLSEKLKNKQKITNSEIRKALEDPRDSVQKV